MSSLEADLFGSHFIPDYAPSPLIVDLPHGHSCKNADSLTMQLLHLRTSGSLCPGAYLTQSHFIPDDTPSPLIVKLPQPLDTCDAKIALDSGDRAMNRAESYQSHNDLRIWRHALPSDQGSRGSRVYDEGL